jgi:hypothetical protein
MTIVYQLYNYKTRQIISNHARLCDAILAGAQDDGYGAEWARDEDGHMRLYYTRQRIGNNPYIRFDHDAHIQYSRLQNDVDAINELAEMINKAHGVLHGSWSHEIGIAKLRYDKHANLVKVNDLSLERAAVLCCVTNMTVETFASYCNQQPEKGESAKSLALKNKEISAA